MSIESHPSFAIVKQDVVDDLDPGFSPLDGDADKAFVVAKPFQGEEEFIGNDRIAVVPWTYVCVHTGDFRDSLCLFPTGRTLEIKGVTLVDHRGEDPLLHRHVDWGGVIVQLGLEVSGRIMVNEEEYANGREILRASSSAAHDGE